MFYTNPILKNGQKAVKLQVSLEAVVGVKKFRQANDRTF